VAIALTEAPSTALQDVGPPASAIPPKPAVAPLPDDLFAGTTDTPLGDWDDPAGMAVALAVPGPEPYQPLPGFELDGLAPALASDLLAEPGATFDPGDDPSAASVVAVWAGHGAGNGFYVRSDLVLTSHRLVGTTSVVDVTTADGATVPALVAGVDPGRNLALLQVPRPGPALVLAESGSPRPGYRAGGDDPPGRPVVADGQVVGMTTGVAGGYGGEVVPIAAIRAFLASQAAVFAAVP
jgi:S1-C subfamily serine protease